MHGLEVVDGKVAFATRRTPAWHQLGTVFTKDLSTQEIMDAAYLSNWNVRGKSYKELLPDGWGTHLNKMMIIRDNPFYDAEEAKLLGADYDVDRIKILGDASMNYEIMQNEELFEFGALFGQRWETAGSIRNGTQVFGSLALETELVIDEQGANDVVKQYLLVNTSHDGSLAMNVGITPVRVVCQNTLNIAMGNLQSKIKIRHSKTMQERMEKAKATAAFAVKYMEQFSSDATELFETSVSNQQFWDIVTTLNPEPDADASKASVTKWENKTNGIMDLWKGETVDRIAGTGWGAFNALTEDQQWNRRVYGSDNGVENFFAAGSGFDDTTNIERNRIHSVVKSMVLA